MGEEAARLLFKIINEQNDEQNQEPQHIHIPCRFAVYKQGKKFSNDAADNFNVSI